MERFIKLMDILKRVKVKKSHSFITILLLVIFLLITYYLVILLPDQRKVEREINKLKNEVTKLQSESDEKKVFSDCDKEAESKARELLAKKIELGKVSGGYDVQEYQKAHDLGLRLKDDYNSFYENCLRRHGIKY